MSRSPLQQLMDQAKREELELSAMCCVPRSDMADAVSAMCAMDANTARAYIRLLTYGFPITTAAREARKATATAPTPGIPPATV